MRNIITKEIKELFSDKKIWIGILTVLIILIIGTSYNIKNQEIEQSELLQLGVINRDDSSYSELLLSYFDQSDTFSSMITVSLGNEVEVKEAFQNGELDIYLEIPEGFARNMIQIQHIPIKVVVNITDTTKAIIFENVLKSYEKYISAVEANSVGLYEIMERDGMDQQLIDDTNMTISLDLIFTALGKESFFDFREVQTFPPTELLEYYMIAILVMILMYGGLYAGFRSLREVRQGTFTRLVTTRTPLYQFIIGKLLVMVVVLAIFVIVALGIIRKNTDFIQIAGYGCIMALFCTTSSIFLSVFFKTTQSFILLGNLLLFYFAVIGGGIIPVMFLPQKILMLSKITPFYHMMEGIIRMNQEGQGGTWTIAMIFLLASILLFAGTLLCYGRRRVSNEEV